MSFPTDKAVYTRPFRKSEHVYPFSFSASHVPFIVMSSSDIKWIGTHGYISFEALFGVPTHILANDGRFILKSHRTGSNALMELREVHCWLKDSGLNVQKEFIFDAIAGSDPSVELPVSLTVFTELEAMNFW